MDRRAALLGLVLVGLALAASPASGGGPTYVEGEIAATAWTLDGSPYVLVGNATVPAGRTLVVDAGVEVLADRFAGLEVAGTLDVRGSADAIVRFTANTTAPDAGFWRGILANAGGSVSLSHAAVLFATTAVSASSATLRIDDAVLGHGLENGISARETTLTLRRSLLNANRVGMTLVAANALVENTTFLGPTLADASLDLASVAFLRMSSSESPPKFVDDASHVEVQGVLAVTVTDAFGVPQREARVLVEDNANGTWSVSTVANAEGRVAGLVVPEQRMSKVGSIDYQPLSVTGQVGALQGRTDVRLHRFAEVTVAVPADLTPPTPIVSRFLAVDEDVPVTFDASASTDNDPDFAATGTFVWRFPEIGVQLAGITAAHTFATPALVQGILTATDAAGNEASLSFAIQVRDVTLPTIVSVQVPATGRTGEVLTFTATATDNDPLFAQSGSYVWRFTRGTQTVERFGPSVALAFDAAGSWAVELRVRDPTGNEAVSTASLAIVAPPTPNPWPSILVGGALFAAALAAATERGKVGLFTLFIPLYTRIKDEDVLDQFTRGQIYGYIRMNPGDTYTDIKRNLGLNNGTLTYHLDVLEKQGYVRSIVRGARKMFFPLDVTPPEDGGGLAEIQRRLVKALNEAPGIAVTDLAASLGVSRQLALYHLRLLAGQGLVRLERRGVRLCGVPVPSGVRDAGRRTQESP